MISIELLQMSLSHRLPRIFHENNIQQMCPIDVGLGQESMTRHHHCHLVRIMSYRSMTEILIHPIRIDRI